MEYKTVLGSVTRNLDNQVNEKLAEGWKLYGSPYATGSVLCQAMVKPAEDEEVGEFQRSGWAEE